ncbi:metal ABC transporter substrate-binding protein [Burkholderia sp. Ac-20384]|uniref:Lipoprotein n=1 Tax=Burkholderia lata (strain ATCC 17760 / DSM 23089 / LMG 22485 / NCIMB 9086 / R18194 / 383) TaxID=482957 RepID=A0A833PSN2_BURL3|nr:MULTISPECIES: MetQ/NlpA family lipoprotein [Burkholderia]KAF1036198.1 MAG: D-methionine-binding lipoprotein MetQ [Burkholderia lata]MBN3822775.1 metal ABC transporter substrate-binding protein [Burkholderia sp. Ac-20384]VWC04991.1 dioxygenase [Burkholderia lata]
MNWINRKSLAAAWIAALLGIGSTHPAQAAQVVRVGIMSGGDDEVWRVVAANAEKRGLTIKVTQFSDYTLPNEALATHDLDANSFQHVPYLDAQKQARHYAIVPVGFTYVGPIGFYSRKVKRVQDLPDGATIGVPNDPSNETRALRLLQALGLITLRTGSGALPTIRDIDRNPKHIRIRELDAGIVGRAIDDLDAAVINTDWAIKTGIRIPQERIAQENVAGNPYRNVIAVNASDANASWVRALVESYQQPNVAAKIIGVYHGEALPAWSGALQP